MPALGSKRISLTGLLAGTLDITAACIQYYLKKGKGPEGVLTYVASGLFGKQAFEGGFKWNLAGLLIHYCIAMSFTLFFALLIKNIGALRSNRFLTGLLYGVFVWAVMAFLVVPLTNVPPSPRTLSGSLQAAGILICCIGMPLSFLLVDKRRNIY